MSVNWTNADGLLVRFGELRSAVRTDGIKNAEDHRLVISLPDATALGTTDTAAATADEAFIPAGAVITRAYFVVDTAFTSGGSATLSIGTKQAAGTNIDADGIDATVAVAALAANAVIDCDGALVPGQATADSYIMFTYGTAAFTAGAGRLIVEYTVDGDS
jgi:hypothetical protein